MTKKTHLFSRCGGDASAANTLVNVVPTLAPRVKGYILSSERTPIPTSGVKAEVKTDDDWSSMVSRAPAAMPT